MYDVVALGELLIDFIQNGRSEGNPVFEANPGGGSAMQCAGHAGTSGLPDGFYRQGGG